MIRETAVSSRAALGVLALLIVGGIGGASSCGRARQLDAPAAHAAAGPIPVASDTLVRCIVPTGSRVSRQIDAPRRLVSKSCAPSER